MKTKKGITSKFFHDSIFKSMDDALMNAEMVIIFVDRDAKAYGPILAFSHKLLNVEIDDLAKRQAKMHQITNNEVN